jgi:excinuclease ABC subunit C
VLSEHREFASAPEQEFFTSVPAAPAVFLLRGSPESEPYVSKSANLRRRLLRLLGPSEERSRRLNLRERARVLEYTTTGSDFESGFLLYQAIRTIFPKTYQNRLRLRFAPLVKLHLDNEYPRASVTTRIGRARAGSIYYGPFPSRAAAEKFANDSLDFFKMRRCVEDLHPDPAFPGCIYSEMKMCLAPCFKGCTDEEYRSEVSRVKAYLDTGGESLLRELAEQRDRASGNLEFENAAAIHAQIEKLKPVLSQHPEIVHRVDHLAGLVIQPSSQSESVNFFGIDEARISGPLTFSIHQQMVPGGKSLSMESRVLESLAQIPTSPPTTALETMEHLAFLSRWYYHSQRMGEIFFADDKGTLPLRRIVRGISRVYRGEKPEPAPLPVIGASDPPA